MKRDLILLLALAALALAIAGGFTVALGQERSSFAPAEVITANYPRPPREARPEPAPPSEPAPARPPAPAESGAWLRDQPLTIALIVGVVCLVAIVVAGKQVQPSALGTVGTAYGRHLFLIAAVVALCVATYLYATTQYVHAAMSVVMALLGFGLWHHHGGRSGP